jgi:REP element-mobilizing transposase RayT
MTPFMAMPRKKRLEESGLIHHACKRGVDGEFLFRSDEDRVGYLAMLAATVAAYGWHCLSYCLMGTHVHLLIETPEPNFGKGMQWLHGQYASCFNKEHGRKGPLYEDRYYDEPVLTEAHLVMAVGYIALNPVDAGLCRHAADWQWGSHRGVDRGIRRDWLAHDHLVQRLTAISNAPDAYERIIASRMRAY